MVVMFKGADLQSASVPVTYRAGGTEGCVLLIRYSSISYNYVKINQGHSASMENLSTDTVVDS